jgi:hypothetical protein
VALDDAPFFAAPGGPNPWRETRGLLHQGLDLSLEILGVKCIGMVQKGAYLLVKLVMDIDVLVQTRSMQGTHRLLTGGQNVWDLADW